MKNNTRRGRTIATMLSMVGGVASAQTTAPATASSDPNPYYLGVSQALTHDTNVTRSPQGPSDNYSSTSLLGGFDQPIGRQRLSRGRPSQSSRCMTTTQRKSIRTPSRT